MFDGESMFITTNGLVLFCKICNVKIAAENRFTVQDILRDKHINEVQRRYQNI